MPAPAETRSRQAGETTRVAFGLAVELDPAIDPEPIGLARSRPSAETAPRTAVRLAPELLDRRRRQVGEWRRLAKLEDDGEVVLSVAFADAAGYLLDVPGFAQILIREDGGEVLCAPEAGTEWEMLIPAQVLPIVATLLGREPFHASAVAVGGRALLFSGDPGAGKSSLAAALVRRGAALLSDDVVALELRGGSLLAHAGTAAVHLRPAEHDRLDPRARAATGSHAPFADKHRYRLEDSEAAPAAPLGALFLLERGPGGELEPAVGVDPAVLLRSSFNFSVRSPERLRRLLDVAAALDGGGHLHRLRVQPGRDADDLAALVLEDQGLA